MYTPPVTPWESVTPEVSDPTHISEHDEKGYGMHGVDSITYDKKYVASRKRSGGYGREP